MVDDTVQRALGLGCFLVAPPRKLRVEHAADETVPWEIFRGHLLDPAYAAASERFAAWHVFLDSDDAPAAAPLVSVRWQRERNVIFVTRQILAHGFEAYEDPPGVILTRAVQKTTTELVGTIDTPAIDTPAIDTPAIDTRAIDRGAGGEELGTLVFLAVVGTSRLPITSLETPLPAFSLGQLAYVAGLSEEDQAWTNPLEFLAAALAAGRSTLEEAKALEAALRASDSAQAPAVAKTLTDCLARDARPATWLAGLLRAVFNGVALSPYTHFADALVALVLELAETERFGPAAALDLLGYMLRHLCRHLTAFDLTLFHNYGANYPDALFLDALLPAFLQLSERHPELVDDAGPTARRRRRALRQAALVRQQYEGHRVPDAPTSMGENTRVLPEPFARVPEEQILERGKRTRRLFADQATAALLGENGRRILERALTDLDEASELAELGMAQFLDRPLGVIKEPGEVDRTPLVSYVAFSRSTARRRVSQLKAAGWIDPARRDALLAALAELSIAGVRASDLAPRERPGVVSVADAAKAAPNFVLLRSTRGSLDALLSPYDLRPLADVSPETSDWLLRGRDVLLVQHVPPDEAARPVLRVYGGGRLRLELGLPPASTMETYREHQGVEHVTRLQLLALCDADGRACDLGQRAIWLNLRTDL